MTISSNQKHCSIAKREKLSSKAFYKFLPMFIVISGFILPQPAILLGKQTSIDKNNFHRSERVCTSDSVGIDADGRGKRATKSKDVERPAGRFSTQFDDDEVTFVAGAPYSLNTIRPFTRESTAGFDLIDSTTGSKWAVESSALRSKTFALDPYTAATSRTVAANRSGLRPIAFQDPCQYKVTPKVMEFDANQHLDNTFALDTGPACTWKVQVQNGSGFIRTHSRFGGANPPPNTGPGTVVFDVSANGGAVREGDIEIVVGFDTPAQVHIVQAGVACTYSVSPASRMFQAQGPPQALAGDFAVSTAPSTGCLWTAVNNNPEIITIISGGTGNGNGTVAYSVRPNLGSASRSGSISVQGQVHTITQDGTPPPPAGCTYAVSPATPPAPFPAQASNNGSFAVTTTPATGCPWTAVNNNPEFITITSGASGSGNETVNYSVAANPGTGLRTGSISVQGQTHTITQNGTPPPPPGCTYAVSPQTPPVPFPASGSSDGIFAVTTTPSGCPWTAINSNPEFITITSGGIGSGAGTVLYSVAANPGNASRTGTITVRDKTHTITQNGIGLVPGCIYEIQPRKALVGEGKGSFGFTVTTTPAIGCRWTAVSNKDFITLTRLADGIPPGTGDGSGIVVYSVAANASTSPQVGEIALQGQIHGISQAASGGCDPTHKDERPTPAPIKVGQTIYGTLSGKNTSSGVDCRSIRGSALLADRYEFTLTEARGVAINVASADFDPFIILLNAQGEIIAGNSDDDGAGFRSSRLPRLFHGAPEFLQLAAGTYIIEVTTFTTDSSGNYAVLVASEGVPPVPAILAAIPDGKTLIVIGENFAEHAKLFIGGSTEAEMDTTNDGSRSRTALIALTSVKTINKIVNKGRVPTLRVVNPDGGGSDVFVYTPRR